MSCHFQSADNVQSHQLICDMIAVASIYVVFVATSIVPDSSELSLKNCQKSSAHVVVVGSRQGDMFKNGIYYF